MIVIVNWYGKKEDKERISRLMDGMAGWIDGHADVLGAFSSSSGSLLSCPPRFLHSCILARTHTASTFSCILWEYIEFFFYLLSSYILEKC